MFAAGIAQGPRAARLPFDGRLANQVAIAAGAAMGAVVRNLPRHVPSCHLTPAFYLTAEWHSGRASSMAEPQLSVRSAKARDLARRLARREHRSIADVVERALEAYEIREAGREPASVFYARLANDYGSDLDLEVVIRENRKIDPGPEL
jgi:hypothetical protein